MIALRHFLRPSSSICVNDFTLCHWNTINEIGSRWYDASISGEQYAPVRDEWLKVVPFIDVWLEVADNELHYVSKLLPTLDWGGGQLGVRLRYEPKDVFALYKEFTSAILDVKRTREAAQSAYEAKKTGVSEADNFDVTLWPTDLIEFLGRRLERHFTIRAYPLDPTKLVKPVNGLASPQALPSELDPIDGDPFAGLIQVNEINAQRGFGEAPGRGDADSALQGSPSRRESRRLSDQLRDYYARHLDPYKSPEPADLLALYAIEKAQVAFDDRLTDSFAQPFREVQALGYPGVTDPKLKISTRVRPADGLNHGAAVQYVVGEANEGGNKTVLRLPEDYNGLGYQNLISMIFRLMGFRDAWMRVGKAGSDSEDAIPPLHLVLVEEPEAHLHAQVQQVFIRKAYEILRAHDALGDSNVLTTQLVVSSHSSHVAHEMDFACLRYFRRLPANFQGPSGSVGAIPISTVINLSEMFGSETDTARFARRYLRTTHCDLFFADAAIFVEGPAERILVPHFLRRDFKYLDQCYISWLEIGGSHAHRLRPLIEHLGIVTLIITDLDACDPSQRRAACQPIRAANQQTNNSTLRTWIPGISEIDRLIELKPGEKIRRHDALFSVRVTYQTPIICQTNDADCEVLSNTFEDALVFSNLEIFRELDGSGLISKFKAAIADSDEPATIGRAMFEALKAGGKAQFALDVLDIQEPRKLKTPPYISEGLSWLEEQLKRRETEILEPALGVVETVVAVATGEGAAQAATSEATVNAGEA
jgi:hypothetical protein